MPINHTVPATYYSLRSLSVYRNLLKDPVIIKLSELLHCLADPESDAVNVIDGYSSFYYEFHSRSTVSLTEYILEAMLYDENPYSLAAERKSSISRSLEVAAENDLEKLQLAAGITSELVKNTAMERFASDSLLCNIIKQLPDWNMDAWEDSRDDMNPEANHIKNTFRSSQHWSRCLPCLWNFHSTQGTGDFCRYKAFIWERTGNSGFFRGIESTDPVRLSDFISYEEEREVVVTNTQQFLKGFTSNNVLLYGDRGSGKSSTVKAILNEYWPQGLRLIEVSKAHLIDFPKIATLLRNRPQRFIIFVDDLAFEDSEESYTALKAALEGGIENKPSNVIIYATSNRRHLVKEKFSDRAGLQSGNSDDEVRAADSIEEKLSLADRFGITVVFSSPDKKRFLSIVEGLVRQRGLQISTEVLHGEAMKWTLWYNGRSPRTARQFVDWLAGQV